MSKESRLSSKVVTLQLSGQALPPLTDVTGVSNNGVDPAEVRRQELHKPHSAIKNTIPESWRLHA